METQPNQYLQHLAQYGLPPVIQVAQPGLVSMRTAIANVCLVGEPKTDNWALVDAGVYFYGEQIADTAKEFFQGPPKSIVLTHGHFDHIGSLQELVDRWDVPVYAHELELPYLTGQANYVEPDPSVGGGWMARLSFLYPQLRSSDSRAKRKQLCPTNTPKQGSSKSLSLAQATRKRETDAVAES